MRRGRVSRRRGLSGNHHVAVLGSKVDGRRGAMKVMVVGEPGEMRSQLKAVLAALTEPQLEIVEGEAATAANLSENASAPPDATLVIFNGNEEVALSFLQSQAQHVPRPILLAVLSARSAGLMKRALRSGADEILFLPLDPGEATRALLKISEARWRTERREGGVIISVMSMVGGVGVTSIAANLAIAMQSLNNRVALLDLDLQTGGLAVFLNLEPEVTIMPLVRLDGKLDSIQLESALTKHSSGVYLLAAPKRIEEGELVSDLTVGTVLELMRQLFDYVIVDCGDHVDENAVAAWERSEHLFYVLNQTIAAARCAWRFIDLFERLGLTTLEPRFILNRYSPAHPLTDKAIESTLAKPIYAKIPIDLRTFENIEMKAQDLFQVAVGSPVAHAVLELAAQVMPRVELASPREAGFMSRLKSAFGQH
jgi:pilus assembly protein CpaE